MTAPIQLKRVLLFHAQLVTIDRSDPLDSRITQLGIGELYTTMRLLI